MMGLLLLLGLGPADLAPGAPELQAAEQNLRGLLSTTASVQEATLRLQTRWTTLPVPKATRSKLPADPCKDPRIELGWRIERFGAAWREAAQATLAQAGRLRRLRAEPTIAPLVDVRWNTDLDNLLKSTEQQRSSFLEASRWQVAFVRPLLALCPVVEAAVVPGIDYLEVTVRDEPSLPVAVLAIGDGYLCPGGQRADGGVVLLRSGRGCWSQTDDCACEIGVVYPGAVLGPEKDEEERVEEEKLLFPPLLWDPTIELDPEVQTDPEFR